MKVIILLLFVFTSCAKLTKDLNRKEVKNWNLEDQGVVYLLERKSVINKKKYLNIQRIFLTKKKEKIVESLKVISHRGLLNNNLQILRPQYAFMELWIDKQKFVSKLVMDTKQRVFKVGLLNRDGLRSFSVPFPKTPRLFCFFSQVIDCLRVTGFFDKVREFHAGSAKLMLIMEGAYLYKEIYEFYPRELFVPAEFVYDGVDKDEHMKFTLRFTQQNIFFTVDKFFKFHSMYWVVQQLNIVPTQK
jgi:hypothetical protein